jgi:hypothetical protein
MEIAVANDGVMLADWGAALLVVAMRRQQGSSTLH